MELARLEHHGVDLVNKMIRRIHDSGFGQFPPTLAPIGPDFDYRSSYELFLGRHGRGGLHIAWDTNLLIDYFNHGRALWNGEALPDLTQGEHGNELESLQMIVTLWVLRDMHFHIMPKTISDSKKGNLRSDRKQMRFDAWHQFCRAISLVSDESDYRGETLDLPKSTLETALQSVPEGNDRTLVSQAVQRKMHVFLTRDKRVLKAESKLRIHGLAVRSPGDLLEDLIAAGAFHCIFEPRRYLYWPMPDQQRVSHLILALAAENRHP